MAITERDVAVLLDAEVSKQIIEGVTTESAALKMFRRLPNMSTKRTKMRVLDLLPLAYWVNNKKNNGKKNITRMAWDDKYIEAAEIAVIIPIKEELLDDADVNIWEEVRPRAIEAFHKKIDDAVFTGSDKPIEWRADLLSSIRNVGAVVEPRQGQTLYSTINDAMVLVEESGYTVNGFLGGADIKGKFRMMLDSNGQPVQGTEIGEIPRYTVNNGAWDKTLAQMIVGDFSQAVYSIRQDITFKVLDQAVIQDPATNEILYNLAQDDMVALRIVMRLGWEIPNPINALSPDESVRFPFAAIAPVDTTPSVTYSTVTFNVKNGEGESVEGAKVTCGSVVQKTDENGAAEFELLDGDYSYTVSKTGYKKQTSETTVDGDGEISVTLA